jgi:hypothetical protein
MSDDIVTRLRNWHDQRDSWQTLTEAADEIERLRAELKEAQNGATWIVKIPNGNR